MRAIAIASGVLLAACVAVGACSPALDTTVGGQGGSTGSTMAPDFTKQCEDTCVPIHAAGETEYRALRECLLCGACADICASSACAAPMETGCSAMATDCGTCASSVCALDQQPDTTFLGVCALQGQACANNMACVTLNNCVAACVVDMMMGGSGGTNGTGGATSMGGAAGM